MRIEVGAPGIRRIFLVTVGLLIVSLTLPVALSGRMQLFYLIAQGVLSCIALILSVSMALKRKQGIRHVTFDTFVNLALCAAGGTAVQGFYTGLPLIPLVFFVGFPFTVFARRLKLFWVPALILSAAAAGRFLFLNDQGLILWAAIFFLFSAILGARMHKDWKEIQGSRSQLERIKSDAREMMGRIREDRPSDLSNLIRREDAAIAVALDEDEHLQNLLKVGCRVFKARTGVLLVPDQPGLFRMRAAALRGVTVVEDLVPAERGFIHITSQRGGVLCVSDATSARQSLGFYSSDTEVGSFIVKIVYDPRWARDAGDGTASEKILCVLYFDSESVDAMSLDPLTVKRLDEFSNLVLNSMIIFGSLQKVTAEMSSRDVISRYAKALTRSLEPAVIAEMALEAAVEAVPKSDGAVVMLYDEGLSVVASRGDLVDGLGSERILRKEPSQMGLLLRRFAELDSGKGSDDTSRAEIIINSEQTKRSPFFRKGENLGRIVSFAALPCFMGKENTSLMAAIAVVSRTANVFNKDELEDLRTISGIMAPALDNAIQHKQVDELSRTDGLTGLLNHRTFQIVLDGKLNHLSRGNFNSVAAIMVDADRFKEVNDTYGHPVGDEVLVELARRLKSGVRKNDAVARYGGEEFAVILDNAGEKEATDISEKMRHSIRSRPFETSAGVIQVTASFGFSVLTGTDGYARKELLEQADQALYQAKAGGRDRVVSYRDIETVTAEIEPIAVDADTVIQEGMGERS